jgi:predicted Zn-dependent protease
MLSRNLAFASLLSVALVACAVSPTGRRQFLLVSEESAIVSSRESYLAQISELEQAGKLVDDPAVKGRVERITSRLVAQAVRMRPETTDWEWSVEVINDPDMVNAWCMAGGRMAIYTGLLQKIAPTDDEIAQVMGHEIAHALANHTAERMSIAIATQAAVVVAGIVSEDTAKAMSVGALAATFAVQMPNSRASESEADEIGIEIAAKAGFNPNAAVTLWQKMERESGGGPPQFMSTHPSPGNRQQRLAELVPTVTPYYQQSGEPPTFPLHETIPIR